MIDILIISYSFYPGRIIASKAERVGRIYEGSMFLWPQSTRRPFNDTHVNLQNAVFTQLFFWLTVSDNLLNSLSFCYIFKHGPWDTFQGSP